MDHFIESIVATADHIRARKRETKRINLSFDEWNVWYQSHYKDGDHDPEHWPTAPRLIEDEYTLADAVVVGGLLISLLRHSDRVTAASLAQLVNVIAPIRTEPGGPAWRQTTFHPFAHTARHARGTVLHTQTTTPTHHTTRFGDVPTIDTVATHTDDQLTFLAVNRHTTQPVALDLNLRAFPAYTTIEHTTLTNPDTTLTNTLHQPNRIQPTTTTLTPPTDGHLTAPLPPTSWNLIRLQATTH
jgi:alpha-N-arabinofuranosidase